MVFSSMSISIRPRGVGHNHRVNPPAGAVTGLAESARPAPAPSAGYAERWVDEAGRKGSTLDGEEKNRWGERRPRPRPAIWSTGSRHGCLGKWQSRMSALRLLEHEESRGAFWRGEGGTKTVGGEAVRSAGAGRKLTRSKRGVVVTGRGELGPRRWRRTAPPNHAAQPTAGARRLEVNHTAVGGAPAAADGERYAHF